MTLLMALIVAATELNGLLSGISFDRALVKLPTRRRIGSVTKPSCQRCWITSRTGMYWHALSAMLQILTFLLLLWALLVAR